MDNLPNGKVAMTRTRRPYGNPSLVAPTEGRVTKILRIPSGRAAFDENGNSFIPHKIRIWTSFADFPTSIDDYQRFFLYDGNRTIISPHSQLAKLKKLVDKIARHDCHLAEIEDFLINRVVFLVSRPRSAPNKNTIVENHGFAHTNSSSSRSPPLPRGVFTKTSNEISKSTTL